MDSLACPNVSCSMHPLVKNVEYGHKCKLTTHKAAGRSLKDAGAFQAFRMGTGSIDTNLQTTCHQPFRQPVELAVTQETVALNETGGDEYVRYMLSLQHLYLCAKSKERLFQSNSRCISAAGCFC